MILLSSLSPIADIAQQAGLIGVLAFGVWLFWRELKDQRKLAEEARKLYDDKFDKMFERLVELEKFNLQAYEKYVAALDNLTEAIDNLKRRIQ